MRRCLVGTLFIANVATASITPIYAIPAITLKAVPMTDLLLLPGKPVFRNANFTVGIFQFNGMLCASL